MNHLFWYTHRTFCNPMGSWTDPGMLGSGPQVWETGGTSSCALFGELVQVSENKTAFTSVLTGDFSFPDCKRNDQVERLKPQAVHVTHWDIGLFSYLKTGSSGHWVKWTTVWAGEATGGRATGNFASSYSQDLGMRLPMHCGLWLTGSGARAEPEELKESCWPIAKTP